MQTSRKLPNGWEDYSPMGTCIENTPFVPFKVPLKPSICKRLSKQENSFTVDNLLEREPRIGLIIDLTFTHYYDPNILLNRNVEYKKIFLPGHGQLPRSKDVQLFFNAVKQFTQKSDKLIGVHCTHGINRTGFMICKYMIEELSREPKEAIEAFEKARGHKIVREVYKNFLLKRTKSNNCEKNKRREPKAPKSVENRSQGERKRRNQSRYSRRQPNDYTYSHRENPSYMPFDESDYIQQMTLNDYQQCQVPHASYNQQFSNYNYSPQQYRGVYNSGPQSSSYSAYQPNAYFSGREHLHGNPNYVSHQNFVSYQHNARYH